LPGYYLITGQSRPARLLKGGNMSQPNNPHDREAIDRMLDRVYSPDDKADTAQLYNPQIRATQYVDALGFEAVEEAIADGEDRIVIMHICNQLEELENLLYRTFPGLK
jgi:hypothetical protein